MNVTLRIAPLLLAASGALACAAAEPQRPDLEAALAEYQLAESSRPVKELIPGWVKPQKLIVVVDKPERTAWLQEAMPAGTTIVGVRREADGVAQLADADALIEVNCPAAAAGAPKLRWVHAFSGGGDTCLTAIPAIARGEVILTNSQKVKNTALAEMGIGYMFALARSVDVTLANQRERELGRRGGRVGKRLDGATILVVGLGGAGTEIARIASAIGMKVIATDPVNRHPPAFVSHVGMPDELPGLVGQADVVMIAAPLTPQTRGLFNKEMFARMKRDAIFINWARADIAVPEDLAAALKAGTIGSAALNWATQTPLTPDHPLWDAPNLILAPWAGAGVATTQGASPQATREAELRWLLLRENMRRFATGGKMYSVFDLARGY
jgi:phosphoglycerate dehydrogenase-like enzyme